MTNTLPAPLKCDAQLLAKLIKRKPVLWVGAGMSMAAGYPSASGLIEAMREKALLPLPAGNDYCAVADAFLAAEGLGSLMDLLSQQFPPGRMPTAWHYAAARLYMSEHLAAVITTNYDGLLEHAFTETGCTYSVQSLDRNQELAQPKRIMKIHGGTDDYQSLVLSRESYKSYAKKYKFLKKQLDQLFTQQSILFVGCSMTDPRILDWLLKLSTTNRKKTKPWFALLTQKQILDLEQATYGTDSVAAILASVPFQVLQVSDHGQVPELFQQAWPLLEPDPVPAPSPTASALTAPVFEEPRLFVGREAEVAKLVAALARANTVSVIYQLQGSGGVGKTALAQMVAASCQHDFQRVLCFYMAEQTPQAFAMTLALELGQEITEPGDAGAARSQISRLLGQDRYLLILENITSTETVADLLPEGTETRVLITTREHGICPALQASRVDLTVEPLELGVFSPQENRQLFQRVLPEYRQEDEVHYDAIGEALGFLPVALRLALNWMVYRPHWSAAELREQLEQKRTLPDQDCNQMKNIQTVYQLGEKITQSQRRVLRHLAVCAQGPVPLSFLERFHGGNATALSDDLEELYNRGWCTRSHGEDPGYQLHVLLRELILQHETIPNMEERFLFQIYTIYTVKGVPVRLMDRWAPQVREALNKWQKTPYLEIDEFLYDPFFGFCEKRGHGPLFLAIADLAMAQAPKDKRLCADALGNQALILSSWGRLEEAYALHLKEEALEKALGDPTSLASVYGNQALILSAWGKLEEAYALHLKEEAIYESQHNRADLAISYANRASILEAWGRQEEADALHNKIKIID